MTKLPLRGRRPALLLTVPTALSLLAGCASPEPTEVLAMADTVSTSDLFAPDAEAFDAETRHLMASDAYVAADPEVHALASVSYLGEGTIVTLQDAPEALPGAMVLTVALDDVTWAETDRWEYGEKVPADAPEAGSIVTLLADDVWQLSTGDRLAVGVAFGPNPGGAFDGFAEVFATPEGEVLPVREGLDAPRRLIAEAIADLVGRGTAVRGDARVALVELLTDAEAWLDALNLEEDAGYRGLLATLIPDADGAAEVVTFAQMDPNWRQLPTTIADQPDVVDVVPGGVVETSLLFRFDGERLPTFVALQFPGIGIAGPIHVDAQTRSATLNPALPLYGAARVVAWYDDDPTPETAQVWSATLPLDWQPASQGLVVRVDDHGARLQPMEMSAFDAELARTAYEGDTEGDG